MLLTAEKTTYFEACTNPTFPTGTPNVLAPMLFNLFIHDLPATTPQKYGYVDDLAILLSKPSWEAVEGDLSKEMNILSSVHVPPLQQGSNP